MRKLQRILSSKPSSFSEVSKSNPLTKGLKSAYFFNDGSGTIARDASGNKNHATFINSTYGGWGVGGYGRQYVYEGVGGDEYATASPVIAGLGNVTVLAHVKYAENGNSLQTICGTWSIKGLMLRFSSGTIQGYVYTSAQIGGTFLSGINDGDDVRLALVYNGTDLNLWYSINNGSVTYDNTTFTGTGSINAAITELKIGGGATEGYFRGEMRHCLVYDRVLNGLEVKSIFANPYQLFDAQKVYLPDSAVTITGTGAATFGTFTANGTNIAPNTMELGYKRHTRIQCS